ncbi:MAG: sigma factor-like helix-turn-helix DNA-binding protein [Patescibacteria group bacterium]|nr:sigma factor-like helix-turn-helix DNA-binding protein [Patescibacteria group bacterium]
MNFNYQKICEELIEGLSERTKDILARRFGFNDYKKETLESIGESYNITRERVRQIEENAIKKIEKKVKTISQKPFEYFKQELEFFGGLKKQDLFLEKIGQKKDRPYILFLLIIEKSLKRYLETEKFYSVWAVNANFFNKAKKIIALLEKELEKRNEPTILEDFSVFKKFGLDSVIARSYIEITKNILKTEEDLYGFAFWPEINPKGIKDRAFIALKREDKPMHFTDIADFIRQQIQNKKPSLVKTVHNELIKNPRFVLVGRGLYALQEWGYQSGYVKDVIFSVLQKSDKPLSKEQIIQQVSKQRFVKNSTILLNLNDENRFLKNNNEKYTIREA